MAADMLERILRFAQFVGVAQRLIIADEVSRTFLQFSFTRSS
jgi:hypothetical protein